MPLSNDPSAVQASVSSPPSYTDASPSERPREALEQFQLLLREFFGAKGHDHLSRHTMTPNPRINESRRGPVSSNSPYRGVTQHKYGLRYLRVYCAYAIHRKTRKWESHIWKSGKQLYCGAFDDAADAAKAHDIIGLRLKKTQASTNFLPACYERLLPMIDQLTEVGRTLLPCLSDGQMPAHRLILFVVYVTALTVPKTLSESACGCARMKTGTRCVCDSGNGKNAHGLDRSL